MVLFVLVRRALAVSGSVAIAFGLHLPNASWLPDATIIASKASVEPFLLRPSSAWPSHPGRGGGLAAAADDRRQARPEMVLVVLGGRELHPDVVYAL